jgi:hypothetical protein
MAQPSTADEETRTQTDDARPSSRRRYRHRGNRRRGRLFVVRAPTNPSANGEKPPSTDWFKAQGSSK